MCICHLISDCLHSSPQLGCLLWVWSCEMIVATGVPGVPWPPCICLVQMLASRVWVNNKFLYWDFLGVKVGSRDDICPNSSLRCLNQGCFTRCNSTNRITGYLLLVLTSNALSSPTSSTSTVESHTIQCKFSRDSSERQRFIVTRSTAPCTMKDNCSFTIVGACLQRCPLHSLMTVQVSRRPLHHCR